MTTIFELIFDHDFILIFLIALMVRMITASAGPTVMWMYAVALGNELCRQRRQHITSELQVPKSGGQHTTSELQVAEG